MVSWEAVAVRRRGCCGGRQGRLGLPGLFRGGRLGTSWVGHGVKAEEGNVIIREILRVSIHQSVEGTEVGSQETWVLISTLSVPTCGSSGRSLESSEPQFPDLKNGKMISFLLSSRAYQDNPWVKGD